MEENTIYFAFVIMSRGLRYNSFFKGNYLVQAVDGWCTRSSTTLLRATNYIAEGEERSTDRVEELLDPPRC